MRGWARAEHGAARTQAPVPALHHAAHLRPILVLQVSSQQVQLFRVLVQAGQAVASVAGRQQRLHEGDAACMQAGGQRRDVGHGQQAIRQASHEHDVACVARMAEEGDVGGPGPVAEQRALQRGERSGGGWRDESKAVPDVPAAISACVAHPAARGSWLHRRLQGREWRRRLAGRPPAACASMPR